MVNLKMELYYVKSSNNVLYIFLSTVVEAGGDSHKLTVDMLNLGGDNCVLTHSNIIHGKVLEGSIPGVLPGTGMPFHFKIGLSSVSSHTAAYTDAELYLTYQCGSEKKFTIYQDLRKTPISSLKNVFNSVI